MEPISITGLGAISAAGWQRQERMLWCKSEVDCYLHKRKIGSQEDWSGTLPVAIQNEVAQLRMSKSLYKDLDDTALFALLAARESVSGCNGQKMILLE